MRGECGFEKGIGRELKLPDLHDRIVSFSRKKWSATRPTKYRNIVVIFVEYPDFFKIIRITKGRKST